MRTVQAAEGGYVTIGRRGENGRTTVTFDLAAELTEYSGAVVSIVARRPGDNVGYPVSADAVSVSSGVVSWVVSNIDTGVAGLGSVTVILTLGDVVAKSMMFGTRILEANSAESVPPDPLAEWYTTIIEKAEEATEAAETATTAASSITPSNSDDVNYILGVS